PIYGDRAVSSIDFYAGVAIITGFHCPHGLTDQCLVNELYDVAVIPQVRRPMAIGFRRDEIRRMVSVGS
ncbi:MAG: hypothetical protein RLZZ435_1923, partial [Cyanobacteriota bacterium]